MSTERLTLLSDHNPICPRPLPPQGSIFSQRLLPFTHTHSQPSSLQILNCCSSRTVVTLIQATSQLGSPNGLSLRVLPSRSLRSTQQGRWADPTTPPGLLQQPPSSGLSTAVEERGQPHSPLPWHHHILVMIDERSDLLGLLRSPFTLPQLQCFPQCFRNIPGINTLRPPPLMLQALRPSVLPLQTRTNLFSPFFKSLLTLPSP